MSKKEDNKKLSVNEIAVFCKKKGFVFPSSEIYGGISGFFDYGPLGVELKNNLKQLWWRVHVHNRADIVGMDGSIILNPEVWIASGHASHFTDVLVECLKCHKRFRADQLVEEKTGMNVDGLPPEKLHKIIVEKGIKCPECGGELSEPKSFNLMFKTYVGPKQTKDSIVYLRPETAQAIFSEFKNIADTSRKKLPFGIAQIGKSFRNEISPRNFLFRCREFEQAEVEYFINERDLNNCEEFDNVRDYKVLALSEENQNNNLQEEETTIGELFDAGIIKSKWQGFWIAFEHNFLTNIIGLSYNKLRIRQHLSTERAHYSADTWDIEYKFPFGWKEIEGISNRTTFDIKNHMEHSKKDLRFFDERYKEKVIPYVVAEPSLGIDRLFLTTIFNSYYNDKKRGNIVLKLKPLIAPIKVAVFPLVSNKKELMKYAKEIFNELNSEFNAFFDKSGSIGRRYARQDEIGTPYCVTIDFDSLKDNSVTLRFRDSTRQIRINRRKLIPKISEFIKISKTE